MLIPHSLSTYHMVAWPWNYGSPNAPYVLLCTAQLTHCNHKESKKNEWGTSSKKWLEIIKEYQSFFEKQQVMMHHELRYPRPQKHPINFSCATVLLKFLRIHCIG